MTTLPMSLWQIEEELAALMESVATCPEELQPELQADIARYLDAGAAKVDATAHVLAALEFEQKAAGDEMARLVERKRVAANGQARLEAYLCRIIEARGGRKLLGKTNTLSVRTSEAVAISDAALVPAEWMRTKVTQEPDKAAIKTALKTGEAIPGAALETRHNLQRK